MQGALFVQGETMDHNPDRICVWPGYFNAKTSRRNGRRVPEIPVLKPDLEGLFYAARKIGLKKIKREENVSPNVRMARKAVCGFSLRRKRLNRCGNKEELPDDRCWRQMQKDAKENEAQRVAEGPKLGSKVARSVRDALNKVLSNVNARFQKCSA